MVDKSTRFNTPTVLVVFGATGDLVERKVLPALFHLFENHRLPSLFCVTGFSRRNFSNQDFQNFIQDALGKHLGLKRQISPDFLKLFSYCQGFFENRHDYQKLAQRLGQIDGEWKVCANKLFYLAVPPQYDKTILSNLAASGLTKPCSPEEGWTRVLVEKPFGKNLREAEALDQMLGKLFREEQIYRIDHYLAKEMLQNIMTFRFANNLFEEVWNKTSIEKIEVKLLEEIGIKGRGDFYDGLGALLDVGQNHLLQMLALVTMENPLVFLSQKIRDKRKELLKQLKILNPEDIKNSSLRGQYAGYLEESGVKKDSSTETYFKIKTFIDLPRWEGVPIFLEGGKKMPETQKEIIVTFRHPVPCLCPKGIREHFKNIICFRIEPNPGISIQFWSKKPGQQRALEKQLLDFQYRDVEKKEWFLGEYGKLLLDSFAGDQSLFISSDEALASWRFIDPIVVAWRKNLIPLRIYPQNSEIFSVAKKIEQPTLSKRTLKREIGLVGLGKMGSNIARHLIEKDWRVVGFNRTRKVTLDLENEGLIGAYSLEELVGELHPPRVIWLMLPAGEVIDEAIFGKEGLALFLARGDILIDAGNSFYKDSIRRAKELKNQGIVFVDVGVSGGPTGARWGASLMVGGDRKTYEYLLPLFLDVSINQGVQFFKGAGAGHFVKMVHNGIEYGMMQAIAEGFDLLKKADYELMLQKVADVYNHGSVIESRLMSWLKRSFEERGGALKGVSGVVGYTGEGEWTVKTAKELKVEVKNIEQAYEFRVRSRNSPSYVGKILTALRDQFGGHGVGEPAVKNSNQKKVL